MINPSVTVGILMGTSNNYQFVTPAEAGVQYC
jgi:hypothetical protein